MERPMIEIKRASEKTIKSLIEKGIIYIGNDNQLHVNEFIPKHTANQNRDKTTIKWILLCLF